MLSKVVDPRVVTLARSLRLQVCIFAALLRERDEPDQESPVLGNLPLLSTYIGALRGDS